MVRANTEVRPYFNYLDYSDYLDYFFLVFEKFFFKKFAGKKKSSIFAASFRGRHYFFPDLFGRLAQLVQSICLTSRGSGVRIPQRPRK